MLKQTLPMHSLLHSLHAEEGLQVKDPGLDDEETSSADYAKPQGAQEESLQTTMSRTALDGLEKMLKTLESWFLICK